MIIKYFSRRKYLLIFLSVLFLISIIVGIIIYLKLLKSDKIIRIDNINLKNQLLENRVNNIFYHFIALLVIFIISLTIIGYFSAIFYLFYEGMSIGFTFTYLCLNYALKGFIFGFIYTLIFKIIYLLLYFLFIVKLFDLIKNNFSYIFISKNKKIIINIKKNIVSCLIILAIILIWDTILYFLGNFVLKFILNML